MVQWFNLCLREYKRKRRSSRTPEGSGRQHYHGLIKFFLQVLVDAKIADAEFARCERIDSGE